MIERCWYRVKPLEKLVHIAHMQSGEYLFHVVLVSLLREAIQGSSSQFNSLFIRESSIASLDEIMVESGVGVPWRTDGHLGEVQVVDCVGGN